MTREEIERFIYDQIFTVLITADHPDWPAAIAAIAARWEEEQEEAFTRGQHSMMPY